MDYDHDRDERIEQWRKNGGSKVLKPYCDRLPPKSRWLWGAFSDYLIGRQLSPHIAKANQWYPSDKAGDDQYRIVMPASSDQEGNHFWQARYVGVDPDVKRYESPYGSTGDAVIVVYPTENAEKYQEESVVVEGPMCALAAAGTGRLGIAMMGADPPEARLDLTFKRVRGTICYVIPDSDKQDLFIHVMSYLANRGVTCRLLDPGPAKDFAEMSPENRRRLF